MQEVSRELLNNAGGCDVPDDSPRRRREDVVMATKMDL